ncbi:hypothetical protein B0H13DRAFT_2677039 [Mycena leptocephala]|nr:hypothetical protein B0H13DRAFT_2677039 [Mycena leptocephala]
MPTDLIRLDSVRLSKDDHVGALRYRRPWCIILHSPPLPSLALRCGCVSYRVPVVADTCLILANGWMEAHAPITVCSSLSDVAHDPSLSILLLPSPFLWNCARLPHAPRGERYASVAPRAQEVSAVGARVVFVLLHLWAVDTARAVTTMVCVTVTARAQHGGGAVRVARLWVCSTSPDPGSVRDVGCATSPRSFDARPIPAVYTVLANVFAGAPDVEGGGAFPRLIIVFLARLAAFAPHRTPAAFCAVQAWILRRGVAPSSRTYGRKQRRLHVPFVRDCADRSRGGALRAAAEHIFLPSSSASASLSFHSLRLALSTSLDPPQYLMTLDVDDDLPSGIRPFVVSARFRAPWRSPGVTVVGSCAGRLQDRGWRTGRIRARARGSAAVDGGLVSAACVRDIGAMRLLPCPWMRGIRLCPNNGTNSGTAFCSSTTPSDPHAFCARGGDKRFVLLGAAACFCCTSLVFSWILCVASHGGAGRRTSSSVRAAFWSTHCAQGVFGAAGGSGSLPFTIVSGSGHGAILPFPSSRFCRILRRGQGQWMLQEESGVYASVPPVHTCADRAIPGDGVWLRGRPRYGFISDDANASGGDSRLVAQPQRSAQIPACRSILPAFHPHACGVAALRAAQKPTLMPSPGSPQTQLAAMSTSGGDSMAAGTFSD